MNIIKGHWQHFHYPLNCAKLKLQIENTINGNISISNNQLPYIANLVSKAGSMISESEWKSHKAKYGDPYSEFVLYIYLVHTHTSENTHTVNTHPEQWAAIYAAAPGEQLGVRCLAQGHLSHGIEGGESVVHSLPPPTCLRQSRDSNSQPFDYEFGSLPLGHDFPN